MYIYHIHIIIFNILRLRWVTETQLYVGSADSRCVVSVAPRGHITASSVTSSPGRPPDTPGTPTSWQLCWRGSPRRG